MALTDSIKTELYQFFSIAFNAAPGVTYMSQMADAVNSGMSVKDVVNVFTTKTEFTSTYPNFFTNAQFAAKLVDTVVGSSATTAAKDQAKADIAAALAGGMTRGDVIYTVFSNLASKPETDADWAGTAKQMANKVAVAQYYTEDLLTDSTNLTTLRAVIGNVTNTTDVSTTSALQGVIDAAFPPTDQSFTLTVNQDRGSAFTGGAGNDTFDGIQGTASTYNAGDALVGGAGTDTLTLLMRADPQSVDSVSLAGIEIVQANVQATDATGGQLDAATWTGVATLSNEQSTGGTLLSVSGLALDTVINAEGNTDVTVAYRGDLSGSANAVSVTLDRFGTGTGTTTTDAGTLTIGTGIETLNVAASGTAYLTVEAGDTLRTITVSATEAMTFVTDELLTSFNAAGLTKTSDFTFNGTSDLAFVGGAGNDTVRLGGTHSNGDSIDGGSGTDTVRLNVGADRSLQASNVENLVLSFTNTTGDLTLTSAQSITQVTVSAASAAAGGSIVNFAGGTVNLVDDALNAMVIDTVTGASVTLVVGGTGDVDVASARVADAVAVTVNSITASAGEVNTITTLNLANTVESLNITAQGSAGFAITNLAGSSLEAVNIVALGSASANIDGTVASTAIQSFTINAIGSTASDVTIDGTIAATKGALSATVNASAGATVLINNGIDVGSAVSGDSIESTLTFNAGERSVVGDANLDVDAAGSRLTVNVSAGVSGTVNVGQISAADITGGEVSIDVSASMAVTGAVVTFEGISGATSQNLNVGAITVGEAGRLALFTANASFSTASFGLITLSEGASADLGGLTGQAIGTVSVAVGTAAAFTAEEIDVSAINGLSVTIALDGSAEFAEIHAGNGSIGDSTITLSQSAEFDLVGDFSASAIGSLTITVGTNASAIIDDILVTGGALSGLSVVVRSAGEFAVDDIFASSMATSIFGVGTAATAEIDNLNASASIAKIFVTGAGTLNIEDFSASASPAIDLSAFSGTFSASFATMSAGLTLTGGPGTTLLTLPNQVSAGVNTVVLATGTGTDTLRYSTAQTDTGSGVDQVANFELGSGGDIVILTSGFNGGSGLRAADGATGATGVAAAADLSVVIAATGVTLDASDNVIRLGTAFANTAAMLSFLRTGITFPSAITLSGEFVVLYATDDATGSSKLAIVNVTADGSGTTLVSGDVALVQTLANFTGMTAGAWTAANITFGG